MAHGYLMEVPLADGENRLVVEVDPRDVPQDLVLAAPKPGELVARVGTSLESALEDIRPGIQAVANWIRSNGPDEFTVEFGLKLGGQTGVIVASGTAEVNFVAKLTWKK
jgi:hypothetical protein